VIYGIAILSIGVPAILSRRKAAAELRSLIGGAGA
jgi:hypothetical protein